MLVLSRKPHQIICVIVNGERILDFKFVRNGDALRIAFSAPDSEDSPDQRVKIVRREVLDSMFKPKTESEDTKYMCQSTEGPVYTKMEGEWYTAVNGKWVKGLLETESEDTKA